MYHAVHNAEFNYANARSERACHTTPDSLFEEFAKPGMSFEMLRQEVDDDTAYIVWKPETADDRFELYPNFGWQIPEKPFGGDRAPSKTALQLAQS